MINEKAQNNPGAGGTGSAAGMASQKQGHDSETNASDVMSQAKSKATDIYSTGKEKATHKLEERKTDLASGLGHVADSVRKVGEKLSADEDPKGIARLTAQYSDTAAEKIDEVARYFESNDLTAMYHDAESFARRNPMVLIGGAFVAGLLAARVFKASDPNSGSRTTGSRRLEGRTTPPTRSTLTEARR